MCPKEMGNALQGGRTVLCFMVGKFTGQPKNKCPHFCFKHPKDFEPAYIFLDFSIWYPFGFESKHLVHPPTIT